MNVGRDIWKGEFTKTVTNNYKISICTTCMNRLHDLKQTLPINMKLNKHYPNLEFIVLDYNSSDGLDRWMKSKHAQPHIESGLLVYYKTTEPHVYSMTHSRNVVMKLATGDIVNNVDADSYVKSLVDSPQYCFAEYINMLANERPQKSVFAKGKQLLHGRIGFFKKEFVDLLGGYDEVITGYGYDDWDIVMRASALGFKWMVYGSRYLWRIRTRWEEKMENMSEVNKIDRQKINKSISDKNIQSGKLKANIGRHWGKATVTKNFSKDLIYI